MGFGSFSGYKPSRRRQRYNPEAFLTEFHPKNDQPVVRMAAAHPANESQFRWRMLLGMGMRPSGFRKQGLRGTVIAPAKPVNKLAIAVIYSGGLRHAMPFGILQYG